MAAVTMILAALLLLLLPAAVIVVGARHWAAGTRALRARLEAARQHLHPARVDFQELASLPAPVQRYLRAVLTEGQPMVAAVRVQHQGSFNLGGASDRWRPFNSEQQVITQRPGFDWDGTISMMPGVSVRVHDAYVAGEGIMHAAMFGLFPVVDLRGSTDLAEGELMRFLAEAAWYPTALLPSQGVRWEAVDEGAARATLADGTVAVTLLFRFGEDGMIDTVAAAARGRMVGSEVIPTPWQARVWNYEQRARMQVPLQGEVAWLTEAGAHPYWRGRITTIRHDFAD